MFGHQDDNQTQSSSQVAATPVTDNISSDDSTSSTTTDFTAPTKTDSGQPDSDMIGNYLADSSSDQPTETKPPGEKSDPEQVTMPEPASDFNASDDTSQTSDNDSSSSNDYSGSEPANGDNPSNDDLLDIKKDALGQLIPLVDHLDQSPEEKFKTTMMMIQAADNQSLIPEAYKAAKAIPGEKARAQALLDIVNEINYFTHPEQ